MATKKAAQEPAGVEGEFELPPGYENQSVGFARAYDHAKKHGNGDKASLLFAEKHGWTFEETDDV